LRKVAAVLIGNRPGHIETADGHEPKISRIRIGMETREYLYFGTMAPGYKIEM
jgi:hypothetical protein